MSSKETMEVQEVLLLQFAVLLILIYCGVFSAREIKIICGKIILTFVKKIKQIYRSIYVDKLYAFMLCAIFVLYWKIEKRHQINASIKYIRLREHSPALLLTFTVTLNYSNNLTRRNFYK